MHLNGTNLLIVEVDGPAAEPLLNKTWPLTLVTPSSPALELDEARVRALVDDAEFSFGHGYVVGALILDGAAWLR